MVEDTPPDAPSGEPVAEVTSDAVDIPTAADKKKKKKKKKKASGATGVEEKDDDVGAGGNAEGLTEGGEDQGGDTATGAKKKKKKKKAKILPPSIPIAAQFPDGVFPVGEIQQYKESYILQRTTEAEKRHVSNFERMNDDTLNKIRKAAECHRQTRTYIQSAIREGMQMTKICEMIEDSNRRLIEVNGLERGLGFPTGCSINEVAAHWTPNAGDNTTIKRDDIVKFDYGVQVDGYIIDCAWTHTFNPARYENLMTAVREATYTGIREAGIDVRLNEIGAAIQETMESYEIEIDGKTLPVKVVRNLNGHSIGSYKIHDGKSVPCVDNGDETKMEENEMFAVETFGSIGGAGVVREKGECSHYMINYFDKRPNPMSTLSSQRTKELYKTIKKNFGTLAFCRRWLDRIGCQSYLFQLKSLVNNRIVTEYPPLVDLPGSYTAQYEHTILLRPECKEVVSRGEDY